jgi:hypothetical protein
VDRVLSAYPVRTFVSETGPKLLDSQLVWCDANLALVSLSAETLDLLSSDLVERSLNVVSDDPEDSFADLAETSSLSTFRRLRSVTRHVPPFSFEDIGWDTEDGFELWSVLGPRSAGGSEGIANDWLEELDEGWEHVDAERACVAAFEAFR